MSGPPSLQRQTSLIRADNSRQSSASDSIVAVYCNNYLPISQTFVRDHLRTLRRYQPVVIANTLVGDGLADDDVPVIVPQRSRSIAKRLARRFSSRALHAPIRIALEQSRARLVHAHFGTGGVRVHPVCLQLDLPLVVTFHGYDVTVSTEANGAGRLDAHYARQRQALLRDACAIVTVSQYLAGRLVQMGADPAKVHVIPCGVDTSRFQATPVPHNRRILFVGRLVHKKGCEDLLRAVAATACGASVAIIGDGPLRDRLSRLARELNVSAEFLGAQPHERVRREIERAQIVAVPSRTATDGDQEGLAVITLEAAASGRPVVGYRHSGIPEAVVDGHTGLLAVEGDIAGLAASLAELLEDPSRSQAMGTMARDRAARLFDLSLTTARLEDVYDRALGSHGGRIAARSRPDRPSTHR